MIGLSIVGFMGYFVALFCLGRVLTHTRHIKQIQDYLDKESPGWKSVYYRNIYGEHWPFPIPEVAGEVEEVKS